MTRVEKQVSLLSRGAKAIEIRAAFELMGIGERLGQRAYAARRRAAKNTVARHDRVGRKHGAVLDARAIANHAEAALV